jgi:biopolymer transport protein ExbD
MGIKKRNKVSAEFSMSSLTDIIFLLLIFFMLTSSLIVPNALNLKMPGSSTTNVTISSEMDLIVIARTGKFSLNGNGMTRTTLYNTLKEIRNRAGSKTANVSVSAHPNAPGQYVVDVLDMAQTLKINAVLLEGK